MSRLGVWRFVNSMWLAQCGAASMTTFAARLPATSCLTALPDDMATIGCFVHGQETVPEQGSAHAAGPVLTAGHAESDGLRGTPAERRFCALSTTRFVCEP